jgi:tetratricopeptide (TPR) repeat protein
MKSKLFIAILILFVQGLSFSKGIAEERAAAAEYDTLAEQANACMGTGDYVSAILLLKRMHVLKPGELLPIEDLGTLYCNLPKDRPKFLNAFYWLTEAEKRGSSDTVAYYNLACIYSLREDLEKAEATMNKALALGYFNFDWMSRDDDLVNLRTGEWWKGIADIYTLIEQQLALFNIFIADEAEKSAEDRISFYGSIVSALEELAPHIPALRCQPLIFLASSYGAMGNYALAERTYLELKAVIEQVLGKEHPLYSAILNKLGTL